MLTISKYQRDQRGSILPIMAVVIIILFAVSAIAIDFARRNIAAEKLQTAGDAASLAGAMSATRYVKLEIDPGKYKTTCHRNHKSYPCCKSCGDKFTVTGKESELIDQKGYKDYLCNCGGGSVKILDRWVEYKGNNAENAAIMFFNLNKPREMNSAQGGQSAINDIKIFSNRSDPRYPSVLVRSTGKIKTIMMNSLNKLFPGVDFTYLNASKCSQGGSFYYDLNGRWHKAAEEGCD
ncbi:Putative Flp pilus-assembly TadE/G-like [Desulfotomaculum arcticum]|uniref:Putative Flp pilus-assembly TadE/G-like n=1 Tax=Desulfotruncus arcticus DSM 17038 TaxID=1121424 RepID=A0A1I2Z924_9FIRM|nr:Tad domain-containing protein [Desulfotruncus arcticus]SFH34016.1 Putative Flp pilus-assembly TadE/G-like [Desulfotomaculum arcticum] [Desulfotruncus arcticus DSM 17038]